MFSTRFNRPLQALAVVSLAMVGLTATAASAHADVKEQSKPKSSEQVAAIVKPSIVYITNKASGWVKFRDGSYSDRYDVVMSCTGFVVNANGSIATVGHCVDPNEIKRYIVDQEVNAEIKDGYLTSADRTNAHETWTVEGHDAGSQPDSTINVYQTVAASGVQVTKPMLATVVDFRPANQGDVALLKVQPSSPMPALQVAPSEPVTGESIVSVGYPGSVRKVVDSTQDPSFKSGQVGSNQTSDGGPVTEIDAPVSPGMSGGPTVDLQGRVVGVNSFKINGETQAFNFITGNSPLQQILARNAVSQTLSASDVAYRTGLDLYFAGKYHAAWKQFSLALQQVPNHALAQSYETKAFNDFGNDKQGGDFPMVLVLGLLAGAAVIITGGVVVMARRRRTDAAPVVEPSPAPPAPPAPPVTPVEPEPTRKLTLTEQHEPAHAFCTSCGTPARNGDRFCGTCGAELPVAATA
jgi:S1-C subfamily serine protease